MKQWKIVRAGTPSSSSTRNVSSHALREWIISGRSTSWRAGCAAGTRPPARRAASARSGGRSRPRRSRRTRSASASATSPSHSASRLRRVVRVQADRRVHVVVLRREVERLAATSRARCRRTPSTRRPRRAPARTCASASSGVEARLARARAGGGSARRPTRIAHSASLPREQRLALLQLRARGQQAPRRGRRAAAGLRAGRAGRAGATARPAAFGITGDASSATIRSVSRQSPSTPATASVSPALLQRPRRAVLDERVGGADQVPDREPNADAKSSRSIAAAMPSYAVAAASTSGPFSARRRARHRRSSSPPCSSTRFARLPKLFARSAL